MSREMMVSQSKEQVTPFLDYLNSTLNILISSLHMS